MKKTTKNIVLLFFCLSLANFANAFKVSPVKLELTIPKGQSRNVALTLYGTKGTNVENLLVYPTDLSISKTGVYAFKKIDDSKFSAASWIKLDEARFTLNEGQKKELKFKISVPLDTKPGEYYSIVMIEPVSATKIEVKDKPMAVYFKARIYVAIILNVPGRIYEKNGQVTSAEMIPISKELVQEVKNETIKDSYKDSHQLFYALPNFEQFTEKTLIVSTFRNLGNSHLFVSGVAIVRSEDGRTSFGQIKLLAMGNSKDETFTFPGDERNFIGVWDKKLPKGKYVADVTFDYGNKVRKATSRSTFSITREVSINENEAEFLVVEKKVDIQVPVGALRTKVVKISNSDYRLINVTFVSDSWVRVEPQSLAIGSGQSKDVKLIVSNDGKSPKKTTIIVKSDRGLASEIVLSVNEKKPQNHKGEGGGPK